MTEAVSSKEICFIKSVFLLCEHGHYSLILRHMIYFAPPPTKNRVNFAANINHTVLKSFKAILWFNRRKKEYKRKRLLKRRSFGFNVSVADTLVSFILDPALVGIWIQSELITCIQARP